MCHLLRIQGVETCAQVSRESHPSGTDGAGWGCGSLVKAQAPARLDVPTALHQFLQHGPRSPTHVESSDKCSTDNRP